MDLWNSIVRKTFLEKTARNVRLKIRRIFADAATQKTNPGVTVRMKKQVL
jgi:hypothetical protein